MDVEGFAGGVAQRIGGGQDTAPVVDEMTCGATVSGVESGGSVARPRIGFAVFKGELDVSRLTALRDDAVVLVVGEGERGAGGLGGGGEVAVRVPIGPDGQYV